MKRNEKKVKARGTTPIDHQDPCFLYVAHSNVIIERFWIVYICWADNIFRQTIPDFHSSAKAKYFRTPFRELQLHILGISMKMFAIAGCEEI